MKSISDILKEKGIVADHRNKHEYQAYGNILADKLHDAKHRTLYIKLAKEEDRQLLDAALAFVLDTDKKQGLGKLFMWKLKELRDKRKTKEGLHSYASEQKPARRVTAKNLPKTTISRQADDK